MNMRRFRIPAYLFVLSVAMIIFMFSGCSKRASGPVTGSQVKTTALQNTASVKEAPEIVQQPSESITPDGGLGKKESISDVTVTIPWGYFNKDFDPEAYNKEKGFISTMVHENGNVSFTMSKKRYEELLLEKSADIEDFFRRILIGGIQSPYVKAIASEDGYRKVMVDVNRAGYKKDVGYTCYEVWSSAQLYQYYLGEPLYCEISVYDVQTGDLIETVIFPKNSVTPAGQTAVPAAGEKTPAPAAAADPKFDFMTDDNLKAVKHSDINADGIVEYVQIYCPFDPQGYYDKYILRIGDTKAFFEGDGIEPEYLSLVDVDKSDKWIEIVVSEIGSSDISMTSFFRYDGNSIIKLGTMDGFYGEYRSGSYTSKGDVIADGSGIVRTQTHGDILHTWSYDDEYIIKNNVLAQVPKDLYLMNAKVTVIKEITLKKSRTDKSPGITLKVGENVIIKETDNKSWCSVVNSKGETGWFEVYDYSMIKGTESNAAQFFDGLCYAG